LKTYPDYNSFRHNLDAGLETCINRTAWHLSNIKKKQHLNAFLEVYEDEALKHAALVDQKIKNRTAGKLAGLVVGLKDVLSFKGHGLQAGSKILNGFIAQYNATAVQRLLDEDAIIIGRQNCDEFAMGSSNENPTFGPVRNDIDNSRVPGGSSGGSAVAVMTDCCQVSLGSDTGGSVRQPAAFCGVVGLKPTYSRISRYGLVAYGSSFDCIGIFSKSVSDCALVLEVIAGPDEFDSTVSQQAVPNFQEEINRSKEKKYKIAFMRDTVESPALQPEIRTSLLDTIDELKSSGHTVTAIEFPLNEYVLPTYYILATAEASSNLSRFDGVRYGHRSDKTTDLQSLYKTTRTEGFGLEVQRRILLGTFVLSSNYYDAYYHKAQQVRRLIRESMKKVFEDHDFILMPTTPTTAFKIGEHSSNPVEMYLADLFSVQANVAGVPGISIPCGKDNQGLPIGLQLLADDFNEAGLMAMASSMMEEQSVCGG
jgi:aspartyl-tRNA(Asn)/glutamyl-tRNA(Gln) amidotransferase subunit A